MVECIFCQIARNKIAADVVYRDEEIVAFRDINPQAPVHFLVVPVRHIANVMDGAAHPDLLARLLSRAAQLGREHCGGGFRIVANTGDDGGQTVEHLHFHVLGGRPLQWPPG